jgi:hypothetical protein
MFNAQVIRHTAQEGKISVKRVRYSANQNLKAGFVILQMKSNFLVDLMQNQYRCCTIFHTDYAVLLERLDKCKPFPEAGTLKDGSRGGVSNWLDDSPWQSSKPA